MCAVFSSVFKYLVKFVKSLCNEKAIVKSRAVAKGGGGGGGSPSNKFKRQGATIELRAP